MGGNALKNCVTRRYEKQEYFNLTEEVHRKLCWCFYAAKFDFIKAYTSKESFGDMDILINSVHLPAAWVEYVVEEFQPKEYVKNGNVLSFEYKEFQIDLIATPSAQFETSVNYFAYNDLGNLLGRIAHSMGLKLGHDGLSYNWRIETYQFKNEVISTDWEEICNVLGVSYDRYRQGFDTLEDIFKFVVASPHFHSDIYLLENRNNYARTRDKKRKTYTEFLDWIEGHEHTAAQIYHKHIRDTQSKDYWLTYQFDMIKGFEETYNRVQAEWAEEVEYKKRFNRDLVSSWTGLKGKELGDLMKHIKQSSDAATFKHFVLNHDQDTIKQFVDYRVLTLKEESEHN